jgi:hypothetical protein
MRSSGVRGLLVYCQNYQCSYSIAISADRWSDDVRLSDIEPLLACKACGKPLNLLGNRLDLQALCGPACPSPNF